MPGSCPVVVPGAADWHERGLEVGQDTELGEDDGALRVAVDVLILPSSISQMPVAAGGVFLICMQQASAPSW